MAAINLSRGRRLVKEAARRLQVRAAVEQAKPYTRDIQRIKPKDVVVLIRHNADLGRIVPKDVLASEPVQLLKSLETVVFIEALHQVHPALARALDTEAGRAWWERQRRNGARAG